MNSDQGRDYYESRASELLAQFDAHAAAWRPFLVESDGAEFADAVIQGARQRYQALIPEIPYIGGDENPMTRHLVRSTTSLALYEERSARGKTPAVVGRIIYDAVAASVSHLAPRPFRAMTAERMAEEREKARASQERRYALDWVWEFVEGDGAEFDYGHDYLACATHKLYCARGALAFLPYYCYLDFVTHRTQGWGFARSTTLSEGGDRCDFRWKAGGETRRGWPPPFLDAPE